MKTPRNSRRLPAKRLVILAAFQPLEAWGASNQTSLSFPSFPLRCKACHKPSQWFFTKAKDQPLPGFPSLVASPDRAFTFGSLEAGSWKLPIRGEGRVLHVFGDLNGLGGSWE